MIGSPGSRGRSQLTIEVQVKYFLIEFAAHDLITIALFN
jgi:hypothetical protein